jgi:hypothetical protein
VTEVYSGTTLWWVCLDTVTLVCAGGAEAQIAVPFIWWAIRVKRALDVSLE